MGTRVYDPESGHPPAAGRISGSPSMPPPPKCAGAASSTVRRGPGPEAVARFVEGTGGAAAIGALGAAHEIVHGRSGALVRPDLPVASILVTRGGVRGGPGGAETFLCEARATRR
ncbi:hypothetical protein QF037_000584 [Streptomyces canus]|nr:hypothetical protein [Streptomyces canus]